MIREKPVSSQILNNLHSLPPMSKAQRRHKKPKKKRQVELAELCCVYRDVMQLQQPPLHTEWGHWEVKEESKSFTLNLSD